MNPARRWLRHTVEGAWDGLDFAVELPEDWAPLPRAETAPPDFDTRPARLLTLLHAAAHDGGCTLQVAARPSVMVTALVTNLVYLLGELGVDFDDDVDERFGPYTGLAGSGWRRRSDGTRESLRWAGLEDGGRLVLLLLAGPVARGGELAPLWGRLAAGFRLLAPRGQRQPLLTAAPAPRAPDPGPPAWWRASQALQQVGRVDEAVALVARECPHAGALLVQAELMSRQRAHCLQAGDLAGARAAHRAAVDLARAYAAGAGSGGEGLARSAERDAFIAALGPGP